MVRGTANPEFVGRLRAGIELAEAGEDDGGTAEGGGTEWIVLRFHRFGSLWVVVTILQPVDLWTLA